MTVASAIQAGVGSVAGPALSSAEGSILSPVNRAAQQFANSQLRNEIPSPEQLIQAYNAGTINVERFHAMMAAHGIPSYRIVNARGNDVGEALQPIEKAWGEIYRGGFQVPAPGELLTLLNRREITDGVYADAMKRLGFMDEYWRNRVERLRFILPSPSDLVSFALREAWDENVVQRFQYDAEFPQELAFWMDRQGANGDARTEAQQRAGAAAVNWSQIYWRVHWANLAPTQAYEMFQRLRPNRIGIYAQEFPGLRAFTLADLRSVLKINDYPLPFRDQLAAIAYRVPRLIDVQRYYANGTIDRTEMVELHKDMGFSPNEASRRADFVQTFTLRQEYKAAAGSIKAAIVGQYQVGIMSRTDAAAALYDHSYHFLPKWYQWQRKSTADRQAEADADDGIRAILDDADRKFDLDDTKQQIGAIRKGYIRGGINDQQVRQRLNGLGVNGRKILRYLSAWGSTKRNVFIMYSTAEIKRLYVEGLFTREAAYSALRDLGWDNIQLATQLGDADLKIAAANAKRAKQTEVDSGKHRKALQDAVRQAEAIKKNAQAALNRQATPAQLRRFFVKGLMDEQTLRAELSVRGREGGTINLIVAQAYQERANYLCSQNKKNCEPAKAAGKQTPPSAGASGTKGQTATAAGKAASSSGTPTTPPAGK